MPGKIKFLGNVWVYSTEMQLQLSFEVHVLQSTYVFCNIRQKNHYVMKLSWTFVFFFCVISWFCFVLCVCVYAFCFVFQGCKLLILGIVFLSVCSIQYTGDKSWFQHQIFIEITICDEENAGKISVLLTLSRNH